MKKRYKLTVSYDGTAYAGWQVQPNGTSIQEKIQDALEELLQKRPDLTGSGRTDAGVHALGQVAHFDAVRKPSPVALNTHLPDDIRILDVEEVTEDFHARYSALGKIYHYRIHTAKITNPFTDLYTHKIYNLDVPRMREAAEKLMGTHDFTSFANEGAPRNEPVKTLHRLDIFEEGDEVHLSFEGNGFLYKMVRNITGTLIDVSFGKFLPDDMPKILAAKNRKAAGTSAPAKGLFLMRVLYDTKDQPKESDRWIRSGQS